MKPNETIVAAVLGVLAATAVSASQPPDVVTSDASSNTAMGLTALFSLTTGVQNTAAGSSALYSTSSGGNNAAFGSGAMYHNTTGSYNSAFGSEVLNKNTTGYDNSAFGTGALSSNSTGYENTAVGSNALLDSTVGFENSAFGLAALQDSTTGGANSAFGAYSLLSNTTGNYNTAFGAFALELTTTGTDNIGIGPNAGYNITTGSYNIDIGSEGVSGDSATLRLGTQGQQTKAFIAGISGTQVTGAPVYVTSTGQLGVLASSERYKTDITPLGNSTINLARLRPVSFHLKTEPNGTRQYGLIAEEVDKIYPDLVIRDSDGKVQGVRYDELTPMLLNEMQKQQTIVETQAAEIHDLKQQMVTLIERANRLDARVAELTPKDMRTAQR